MQSFPSGVPASCERACGDVSADRGLGLRLVEAGLGAAVGGLDGKAESSAYVEDALQHLLCVNSLDKWCKTKI